MLHSSPSRQPYLDWLRLGPILGVLLFHCCMPFATGESWHIRNAERSGLLLEFVIFLHLFRMPLLFFISGTVSYYMMQRRSAWGCAYGACWCSGCWWCRPRFIWST